MGLHGMCVSGLGGAYPLHTLGSSPQDPSGCGFSRGAGLVSAALRCALAAARAAHGVPEQGAAQHLPHRPALRRVPPAGARTHMATMPRQWRQDYLTPSCEGR